jgi:predicted regulator of Ras-like GTPase activity (Roadblock/LC7/MglB family)
VIRLILHELLATTPGALAALFLDWEGETVDLVCDRDIDDHDLRILGAYQVISLTRLKTLCEQIGDAEPSRFKVEYARKRVLSADVREGYYLVLILDESSNEGLAWRTMDKCRTKLLDEM